MPSNHPHFNPGPGVYKPVSIYNGGKTEPGGDCPKVIFGLSQKLISPEKSFSATVFISNVSTLWTMRLSLENGPRTPWSGVTSDQMNLLLGLP